jgi:hypothetical protein
MEHIHNNLMKLGGSPGNVPHKIKTGVTIAQGGVLPNIQAVLLPKKTEKKACLGKQKTLVLVPSKNFISFHLLQYKNLYCINCTLENGLTVRNISRFYYKFFIFCGTLPSDPPNFIGLS